MFWCFFHAVCRYRARHGALRATVSGSLRIHKREEYRLSFAQILSSRCRSWIYGVNWLHIGCVKYARRNCSELIHCPIKKDQYSPPRIIGDEVLLLCFSSPITIAMRLPLLDGMVLIDRLYCAEEQCDVSVIAADSRTFHTVFTYAKLSCFKALDARITGWTDSVVNFVEYYHSCSSVPDSVWFIRTSLVPCIFAKESASILRDF